MAKRVTIIAILVALSMLISVTAFAETKGMKVRPTLSISGTTATCRQKVSLSGAAINLTLELYRDGVPIVSWNASGTGSVTINETYTVTSGHTYYLYAYGTAGGAAFNGQSSSISI